MYDFDVMREDLQRPNREMTDCPDSVAEVTIYQLT